MLHKVQMKKQARLTGIETDGPSAGELVCPFINLWKINGQGVRIKRSGKLAHDTAVTVLESIRKDGVVMYYVRAGRVRGWVTERFVVFEEDA